MRCKDIFGRKRRVMGRLVARVLVVEIIRAIRQKAEM